MFPIFLLICLRLKPAFQIGMPTDSRAPPPQMVIDIAQKIIVRSLDNIFNSHGRLGVENVMNLFEHLPSGWCFSFIC